MPREPGVLRPGFVYLKPESFKHVQTGAVVWRNRGKEMADATPAGFLHKYLPHGKGKPPAPEGRMHGDTLKMAHKTCTAIRHKSRVTPEIITSFPWQTQQKIAGQETSIRQQQKPGKLLFRLLRPLGNVLSRALCVPDKLSFLRRTAGQHKTAAAIKTFLPERQLVRPELIPDSLGEKFPNQILQGQGLVKKALVCRVRSHSKIAHVDDEDTGCCRGFADCSAAVVHKVTQD